MPDPVAFFIAALVLLGTPGPTNTLLFSAGLQEGLGRSWALLPAEVGGYSISIVVLALLSRAFASVPSSTDVLRLICAAYLVYTAVRTWRTAAVASPAVKDVTPLRVFTTTLLNPKAMIFAFVIVPYLRDGDVRAAVPYLASLAGLILVCGFTWIAAGSCVRSYSGFTLSTATIRRATSLVLVAFATWIGAQVATG